MDRQVELLRELIDLLPEREREIVNGVYYERVSYAVIGERIGCTRQHVMYLLHRAEDRLRDALKELEEMLDE